MITFSRYKFTPKHLSKYLDKELPTDIEEYIANFVNQQESFAIELIKHKFEESLGNSLQQNYNNFFNIDFRVLYFKFGLNKYNSLEKEEEQEKLKEEFIKKFMGIKILKQTLSKIEFFQYEVATNNFSYNIESSKFNEKIKTRNKKIDQLNKNMRSLKKEYNITVKKNIIDYINSGIEKYNKLKHTKLTFIKLNKLLELYPKQRYLLSTRTTRTSSRRTRSRRASSRRASSRKARSI